MCEQCCAGTNSWGSVVPGFSLMKATRDGNGHEDMGGMLRNDYGLVQSNDPTFVWQEKPTPCPVGWPVPDEMSDEEDTHYTEWWNATRRFENQMLSSVAYADDVDEISVYTRSLFELHSAVLKVLPETDSREVFEALFHLMGLVLEQNPEPIRRGHDDEGADLNSVAEQLNRILGLPNDWNTPHKLHKLYRTTDIPDETYDGMSGTQIICFPSGKVIGEVKWASSQPWDSPEPNKITYTVGDVTVATAAEAAMLLAHSMGWT
jgi:hypothetical protein